MARLRFVIRGRVQGVFFRVSIIERAGSLGLVGWVRNCRDGAVEAVAEGSNEALEALQSYCWKGPPGAAVRAIDTVVEPETGEFSAFVMRPEA